MALKGVPKSPEHRAKLSAANLGKRASMETRAKMSAAALGKAKSVETRALMSAARIGMVYSEITRAKMSAAKRGKPAARPFTPEDHAKSIAIRKGRPLSVEHRRKLAAKKFGHEPQWRHERIEYGGARFRSTWEARVAKALDALDIRWQYEPTRFHLGPLTYRPDFYLPDEGVYWEVKGYFAPRAKLAVQLFRTQRPEPLVVVNGSVIDMLERAASQAA